MTNQRHDHVTSTRTDNMVCDTNPHSKVFLIKNNVRLYQAARAKLEQEAANLNIKFALYSLYSLNLHLIKHYFRRLKAF